jgi:hypothetical protein
VAASARASAACRACLTTLALCASCSCSLATIRAFAADVAAFAAARCHKRMSMTRRGPTTAEVRARVRVKIMGLVITRTG